MYKTTFKVIIICCIVLSILPYVKAGEKTNFVLCMTDDQGWGDAGYMGHRHLKTPVLDEMAAQGLRFDRFYAPAPVCSPSRGGFITGRAPSRYGCYNFGLLNLDAPTLPANESIGDYGTTRWLVWCKHCNDWHVHGPMEGHREAHCHDSASPCRVAQYELLCFA